MHKSRAIDTKSTRGITAYVIFGTVLLASYSSGTLFQSSYAQENSSPNLSGYSEFIGFDKDFSLQHPSDWILEPKTNRFESVDLKITSPTGVAGGFIMIQYSPMDPLISNAIKQDQFSQVDVEENLDLVFPNFLSGFASVLENYNQVEELNYVKYLVDGHKTGSVVYGFSVGEQDLAGLLIWTLVGNNQFWLAYGSNRDTFDQNLPIAENVLRSVKFLK